MAIDQRFTTLAVASVATVGCGYLVYRLLYRQEESSQKTALEDMEHQVGGHACAKTSMKLYRGHVLKPFQSKNRGERELAFYESVPTDVPFVPAFYGVIRHPSTDEDGPRRYLQIENLLGGMIHPCIMDAKVGTKSYEPTASRDKIALEIAKCPLQATMGFRLQGIKVYWDSKQEHVSYDKYFFRDLATAESIEAAFVKYFEAGPDHVPRYYLLEPFLAKLHAIREWLHVQTDFHFIASSLLFVYDANPTDKRIVCDVRLIDFAHVQLDQTSRDEDVLVGVNYIIGIFERLLESSSSVTTS
ncbi:hypothetical protein LEN26_011840 [Aphanomyces euteiches]|nr:hypothetical protein LEN26_011840 [Aphanomyces euteiches]KAH9128365.1 hypothetical protein AeMF1_001465 [Aphanomyces euteiches]KAH9186526.1 hypothetical protein AeNC1_011500 [Aphanomyces euteiches]